MNSVSTPKSAVLRLSADIVVSPSTQIVADLALTYAVKSPYEIRMSFRTERQTVVWKFARDLLIDARIEGESGLCDVQVAWDEDYCSLTLNGSGAVNARVSLPARRVEAFLAQTVKMIPQGAESRFFSVPDRLPADW